MLRIPQKKFKKIKHQICGIDKFPIAVIFDIIKSNRLEFIPYNNEWIINKYKDSTCLGIIRDIDLHTKYPKSQETYCYVILNRHKDELWVFRKSESMAYQYIKMLYGDKICKPQDDFLTGVL